MNPPAPSSSLTAGLRDKARGPVSREGSSSSCNRRTVRAQRGLAACKHTCAAMRLPRAGAERGSGPHALGTLMLPCTCPRAYSSGVLRATESSHSDRFVSRKGGGGSGGGGWQGTALPHTHSRNGSAMPEATNKLLNRSQTHRTSRSVWPAPTSALASSGCTTPGSAIAICTLECLISWCEQRQANAPNALHALELLAAVPIPPTCASGNGQRRTCMQPLLPLSWGYKGGLHTSFSNKGSKHGKQNIANTQHGTTGRLRRGRLPPRLALLRPPPAGPRRSRPGTRPPR